MPEQTDANSPAFINPNPGHCRDCGVELANKRHQYCTAHRTAKAPPQRRAKSTRIADAHARGGTRATVLEVLPGGRDAAKTPGKVPTSAEWQEGISKLLVGATWAVGMTMTRGEPRQLKGQLAVELSMTDDEAGAIAKPIAGRLATMNLNRKHGRQILESLTLAEPLMAVMHYVDRLHEYSFERGTRLAAAGPPPAAASYPSPVMPGAQTATERPTDEPTQLPPGVPGVTGWTGGAFGSS